MNKLFKITITRKKKIIKCYECGHKWKSKSLLSKPLCCPKCKSERYWVKRHRRSADFGNKGFVIIPKDKNGKYHKLNYKHVCPKCFEKRSEYVNVICQYCRMAKSREENKVAHFHNELVKRIDGVDK